MVCSSPEDQTCVSPGQKREKSTDQTTASSTPSNNITDRLDIVCKAINKTILEFTQVSTKQWLEIVVGLGFESEESLLPHIETTVSSLSMRIRESSTERHFAHFIFSSLVIEVA